MGKETLLIEVGRKIKPAITKIIPIEYLRKMKDRLVLAKLHKIIKRKICPYEKGRYPHGINLIASIQGDFGLGQSSRLIANVLEHMDFEYGIYNFITPQSANYSNHSFDSKMINELKYDINLIHINPLEMEWLYLKQSKENWDYRYNIAFWLWELEEFPDEWTRYFPFLDEIWTPSEFVSESIRKKTNLPVKTMPYYVTVITEYKYNRKYFDLPEDKFLFLTMYDMNSVKERKNPNGVIRAFKEAFSKEDERVGLVVKINGGDTAEVDKIKMQLEGYKNIYFFVENMQKIEVNGLINCADVFVSLHRAEGFGLVMAEAMLLGVPVIATNWSSNVEFMNPDVACMVEAELVELKEDYGPFKKGNRWAEPDIEQASGYMVRLFEDGEYYNQLKNNAEKYLQEKLSFDRNKILMNNDFNQIFRGET